MKMFLAVKFVIWIDCFLILMVIAIAYGLDTPIRSGLITGSIAGFGFIIILESEVPLIRPFIKRKLRRK